MRREESRRTRRRGLGGTLPDLTNLFAICMPAFPGLFGRRLHSPLIQKCCWQKRLITHVNKGPMYELFH